MRQLQNRYSLPEKPVVIKRDRALLSHISPPILGISDDAKTNTTDQKFAGVLQNMYVNDDRLTTRAGFKKMATMPGGKSVDHLIPYYGEPHRIAAATNNTLCDAITGLILKAGFTSNDWHWTTHSDLGDTDRTVMVNGADGVWSWDGLEIADVGPITITKIGKATSPKTNAVITVGAADISKFHNNDAIVITGADAAHASANGPQRIWAVGDVANTFELLDVDSTNWGGDQTTGTMRATIQGSFVQEAVKPPEGATWMQVNNLSIVVAHMNRLFFTDEDNLCAFYLPLQQRHGELKVLPLNAIFRRGGSIKAMATWTVDGGMGMDDQLVFFSTHGEIAIYSGIDPDDDFTLVGVFRMEAPMSKWSVMNYGGELYMLNPVGLVPMSTVLKSGREGQEAADKNIVQRFRRNSILYRDNYGWELQFNPNTGRALCNVPQGGGVYQQMMRSMAKPSWGEWKGVPARCWGWIEPYLYFGDDLGNVYYMHPDLQSDDGKPIEIDVQTAWSQYKTPAIKHFKMLLPYVITDGVAKPSVDMKVDYDTSPPVNIPDITQSGSGSSTWNESPWATSDADGQTAWVYGTTNWANWTGVGSIGRVGAVRMTARIQDCTFHILGWDVLYDKGSVFG